MYQECIYTEDQLRSRLAFWQQTLRLQDWRIDIGHKRMAQFEIPGRSGELHVYSHTKVAVINILHPEDYAALTPQPRLPHDMEWTLVHELMHLSMHHCTLKYDTGSLQEMLEEQAVNALTAGFISFIRPGMVQVSQGLLPGVPDAYAPIGQQPQRPHLAVSNNVPPMPALTIPTVEE